MPMVRKWILEMYRLYSWKPHQCLCCTSSWQKLFSQIWQYINDKVKSSLCLTQTHTMEMYPVLN